MSVTVADQQAFVWIDEHRAQALREMFRGRKLVPRSVVQDAKALAEDAKALKKKVSAVPGMQLPSLDMPNLQLNVQLFDGIRLDKLIKLDWPKIVLPDLNLSLIPDIKLLEIPGFSLPKIRFNLKGILAYKDLLPNISLRVLVAELVARWPHLSLPSLLVDLSAIFDVNVHVLFPKLRLHFPEFFSIALPDWQVPSIHFPDIDLPSLRLPDLDLPGISLPTLLRMPGFGKVLELLRSLFDAVDLGEIIGELGLEFFTDFVSSALPVVQQVKAGAQAVASWASAVSDWYKRYKLESHKLALLPGNARAAAEALGTLLERARNSSAALATIQTTQFAVSTAGLFADLGAVTGPAVAAVSAFAKMCHKVMLMGIAYREVKLANRMLSERPNDFGGELLEACPLLGCYYLANSTTSTILNFHVSDYDQPGWQDRVEKDKKQHLDPLIKECKRFIAESRYVIAPPLAQNIGMFKEMGIKDKVQAHAKLAIKQELGMAPAHAVVGSHQKIG